MENYNVEPYLQWEEVEVIVEVVIGPMDYEHIFCGTLQMPLNDHMPEKLFINGRTYTLVEENRNLN